MQEAIKTERGRRGRKGEEEEARNKGENKGRGCRSAWRKKKKEAGEERETVGARTGNAAEGTRK